ncbi:MerR family transcriptional regulator [Oceanitalea stevensii]|uniref:MerR family transcriptional regulator n=1 Tax=Oceanitalea stevensii TaxID=2763072 RepID=A0ABR8Z503_9MICO|nr:MerR family transcriptional regulator [Oceanitalea stevensii]MBD8063330.1 MerR family transcriptional regulator [Oceanitalea stevensii]
MDLDRSGLATSAVAAASGYSSQQVRDLESSGVISQALRSPAGYRHFTQRHVVELAAYRDLATAVGPVEARRVMREVRAGTVSEAVALVGALHVRLERERAEALAARRALRVIEAEGRGEGTTPEDAMTIRELAKALAVRASTLRFWESCGLVAPERVPTPSGSARLYPAPAVREARITAALRAAGYRVPEVREAIEALRRYREVERPLEALDARVESIGRRGLALLRAGAVLAEVIGDQPRARRRE